MLPNYPPGITGNEPQIAGSDWETWLENLKPGDAVWHLDGSEAIVVAVGEITTLVDLDGARDIWRTEDCTQPETTPFHLWAAEQGEGE